MYDVNIILLITLAVIMALVVGFFDALVKQVQTGVWDYGYLISVFFYSVFVGVLAGTTGLIDLNMPVADIIPVLTATFTQYFVLLVMLHSAVDFLIVKIFPTQPQGLATTFMRRSENGRAKLQTLAMIRKP
jgi:hypothetical protein